VFYISGAVYVFGVIFYGLFGSGEMQPWAEPKVPDVNVISGLEQESKNQDDLVMQITTTVDSDIFEQKDEDQSETNFDANPAVTKAHDTNSDATGNRVQM